MNWLMVTGLRLACKVGMGTIRPMKLSAFISGWNRKPPRQSTQSRSRAVSVFDVLPEMET